MRWIYFVNSIQIKLQSSISNKKKQICLSDTSCTPPLSSNGTSCLWFLQSCSSSCFSLIFKNLVSHFLITSHGFLTPSLPKLRTIPFERTQCFKKIQGIMHQKKRLKSYIFSLAFLLQYFSTYQHISWVQKN